MMRCAMGEPGHQWLLARAASTSEILRSGAGCQFDIHPLDSPLWGSDEDETDDDEPPQNN